MNFAIVGCGLVGQKRARALGEHRLAACADVAPEAAKRLAETHPGCDPAADPADAIRRPDVDAVLVCTPHHALAELALAAVEAGKHVLLEKPGARRAEELRPLLAAAQRQSRVVQVGFNHRFHPALRKAHDLFTEGAVGELMHIRARYGHGGRPGYEKEWRADKELAGGGELLDQGSHLIDLARWFAGDFADVQGRLSTSFWDMPVEDNAFMSLRARSGAAAWLHASWTEWKNLFSFEVFGRTGKLQVDGLGGSYGPEQLTFYRMLPQMGPPQTSVFNFPGEDHSWEAEIEDFARRIASGTGSGATLNDAVAVLEVIGQLYQEAGA